MSKQESEEEPSIEEILSSIRQIISDEEEEGGADVQEETAEPAESEPVAAVPEEPVEAPEEPEGGPEEDILELTDKVDDDSEEQDIVFSDLVEEAEADTDTDTQANDDSVDVEPEAPEETKETAMPEAEESVESATSEAEEEPAKVEDNKPEAAAPVETPSAPVPPVKSEDEPLLSEPVEKAALDAMSELAKKTAVDHQGITLEDIVRAELKPLLKQWLDKHLPGLIERLVREELDRVAKRAMDE